MKFVLVFEATQSLCSKSKLLVQDMWCVSFMLEWNEWGRKNWKADGNRNGAWRSKQSSMASKTKAEAGQANWYSTSKFDKNSYKCSAVLPSCYSSWIPITKLLLMNNITKRKGIRCKPLSKFHPKWHLVNITMSNFPVSSNCHNGPRAPHFPHARELALLVLGRIRRHCDWRPDIPLLSHKHCRT